MDPLVAVNKESLLKHLFHCFCIESNIMDVSLTISSLEKKSEKLFCLIFYLNSKEVLFSYIIVTQRVCLVTKFHENCICIQIMYSHYTLHTYHIIIGEIKQ